jgi:hypothetical protein
MRSRQGTDGVADLSLERPDGFPLGLALGHLPFEVGPPSESFGRIWQMATMWMAWLSWRLPRRLRRWVILPPEECSMGATPA